MKTHTRKLQKFLKDHEDAFVLAVLLSGTTFIGIQIGRAIADPTNIDLKLNVYGKKDVVDNFLLEITPLGKGSL
jgi:hypothetical protein